MQWICIGIYAARWSRQQSLFYNTGILRQPLPNILVGPNCTKSSAIHDIKYEHHQDNHGRRDTLCVIFDDRSRREKEVKDSGAINQWQLADWRCIIHSKLKKGSPANLEAQVTIWSCITASGFGRRRSSVRDSHYVLLGVKFKSGKQILALGHWVGKDHFEDRSFCFTPAAISHLQSPVKLRGRNTRPDCHLCLQASGTSVRRKFLLIAWMGSVADINPPRSVLPSSNGSGLGPFTNFSCALSMVDLLLRLPG